MILENSIEYQFHMSDIRMFFALINCLKWVTYSFEIEKRNLVFSMLSHLIFVKYSTIVTRISSFFWGNSLQSVLSTIQVIAFVILVRIMCSLLSFFIEKSEFFLLKSYTIFIGYWRKKSPTDELNARSREPWNVNEVFINVKAMEVSLFVSEHLWFINEETSQRLITFCILIYFGKVRFYVIEK